MGGLNNLVAKILCLLGRFWSQRESQKAFMQNTTIGVTVTCYTTAILIRKAYSGIPIISHALARYRKTMRASSSNTLSSGTSLPWIRR